MRELTEHSKQEISKIAKFRIESQSSRQYLIHIEFIQLKHLVEDKDYLKVLLAQFSSTVQIKVSLIMIRNDLFSDDAYDLIFELEFLPKMGLRVAIEDKIKVKDKENIRKNPYHIDRYGKRQTIFSIAPIKLKLSAILKIIEDNKNVDIYHVSIQQIVLHVILEKRQTDFVNATLRTFIRKKLIINVEKKSLALNQIIQSASDCLKLEAAGMQLGFLTRHKQLQQPVYAISIIERLVQAQEHHEDRKKKIDRKFNPDNMFQTYFDQINNNEPQIQKTQKSLHDLIKTYKLKYLQNTQ